MPKTILLIESDTALAGSIAGALHARGAEVSLARDAGTALEVARGERPDAIVLCAELVGGSGFAICNKLRKDSDLREIPLLLTSADASDETFEQHRKLKTRADAYLHKPFAMSELIAQLTSLAGLPDETPGQSDDEDLLAFDAAFASIAPVDEGGAPIDHPISFDDVDAAAALVADLPEVEEPPPPRVVAFAKPPPSVARDAALAELDGVRAELARVRAELDEANAARAELARRLEDEQSRASEGEAKVKEQLAAERARIRCAVAAALAEIDRS
jgi:CheY-like chemotaxis protein